MEHLWISHRDPSALRTVERTHSSRARSGSGREPAASCARRPLQHPARTGPTSRRSQLRAPGGVQDVLAIRAASGSPGSKTSGTGSNRSSVPAPRAHGRRNRTVLRQPPPASSALETAVENRVMAQSIPRSHPRAPVWGRLDCAATRPAQRKGCTDRARAGFGGAARRLDCSPVATPRRREIPLPMTLCCHRQSAPEDPRGGATDPGRAHVDGGALDLVPPIQRDGIDKLRSHHPEI